jgi:hypothetical protein
MKEILIKEEKKEKAFFIFQMVAIMMENGIVIINM